MKERQKVRERENEREKQSRKAIRAAGGRAKMRRRETQGREHSLKALVGGREAKTGGSQHHPGRKTGGQEGGDQWPCPPSEGVVGSMLL